MVGILLGILGNFDDFLSFLLFFVTFLGFLRSSLTSFAPLLAVFHPFLEQGSQGAAECDSGLRCDYLRRD